MSQPITLAAGDVARLKRAIAGNSAFSFSNAASVATSGGSGGSVVFSAGASSGALSAVTFDNSNNVTFGLSNGVITAIANTVGGGAITNIKFSAGSYSTYRSDITFNNSNGVTFGQDTNGVITATVATNYQSQGAYLTTAQPPGAYLTTAALSQDSSKYAGTSTAMTGGSVTLNTAGIAIDLPAYLTTAQPPGAYLTTAALSQDSSKYAGTSTGMAGGSVTLDTGGISISLPAYLTTAQPPGAYLTTAALSQDSSKYAGTSTGMAGGSVTLNTAGISISLPAYLTTAQPPGAYLTTAALSQDSSKYAGTSAGMAGGSVTLNTSGISISLPAYLTTAALSGDTSKYAGTSTGMTGGSVTLNTAGIAISLPAYLTTFPRLDQVQNPGADAVFSMGSNAAFFSYNVGGSFSTNATREGMFQISVQGNVTQEADVVRLWQGTGVPTQLDMLHIEGGGANVTGWRVQMGAATVGAEINQPIKFTTADSNFSIGSVPMILGTQMSNSVANLNANYLQGSQASQFAASNITSARAGTATSVVTTGGTDLSMALDTSGLTVAYAKWITTYANDLTSGRAGTGFTSTSTGGVVITAALGTNGLSMAVPNYITTYVNDLTSQRAGTATSVVTTAGTDLSCALNTGGLTIAYPKWLTTAAVAPGTGSYWSNIPAVQGTSSFSLQSNSVNVQPFCLPFAVSASYLRVPVSFANMTSTTVAYTSGSRSFYYYQSINAVLYSQGVGASSRSLQYVGSSYAAFTEAFLFSVSNAGTNESIAYQITYPAEGNNTANAATTMLTTAAGASIYLHTTGVMTNFTGIHWLDIPLATLLGSGCYWVAFNRSTNTTTSGAGIAITNNVNRAHSFIAVTQINSNFVPLGFASSGAATASTQPVWQIGLGSHSVSAQGATTSSLALSSVSSVANFPIIPMQLINQA